MADGQELDNLLIRVDSELGNLNGIHSAVGALQRLASYTKDASNGIKQIKSLGLAFQSFNNLNLDGIEEASRGVRNLVTALDDLSRVGKVSKKAFNDFGKLGTTLRDNFTGIGQALKGIEEVSWGVNNMVKALSSLGQVQGVTKQSITQLGQMGEAIHKFNGVDKDIEKIIDPVERLMKAIGNLGNNNRISIRVDPNGVANVRNITRNTRRAMSSWQDFTRQLDHDTQNLDLGQLFDLTQPVDRMQANLRTAQRQLQAFENSVRTNADRVRNDLSNFSMQDLVNDRGFRNAFRAGSMAEAYADAYRAEIPRLEQAIEQSTTQAVEDAWRRTQQAIIRDSQLDLSRLVNTNLPIEQIRSNFRQLQNELSRAESSAQRAFTELRRLRSLEGDEQRLRSQGNYRTAAYTYATQTRYVEQYRRAIQQLNQEMRVQERQQQSDVPLLRQLPQLEQELQRYQQMYEQLLDTQNRTAEQDRELGVYQSGIEAIQSRLQQIRTTLEEIDQTEEGNIERMRQLADATERANRAAAEMRSNMNATVGRGFTEFGNLLSGSGNKVLGSLGNLSSTFGSFASRGLVSEGTVASLEGVATALGHIATAASAVIAVAGVVIAVFKAWWDITGKMVDALKQFVQKCIDFAKNMLSTVVGAFNAVAGAVRKVASVVQSAAQLIQSALRKIVEVGNSVISTFGKVAGSVASVTVKAGKAIANLVTPRVIKNLASVNLSIKDILKNSRLITGAIKSITKWFTMLSRMLMRKIVQQFLSGLKQAFDDLVVYERNAGDEMLRLNENVSKIFSGLRRGANQWVAAFEPLINFLTPMITGFLDGVQTMGEAVAKFMAQLTGQPYYLRARRFYEDYGKNVEETSKKVKNLTNGLDELNILNDSKDTTDNGYDPKEAFEKVDVDGSIKLPDFKIDVDALIDKLVEWLKKIPWDKIKQKIRDFVNWMFDTFIDVILRRKDLWEQLGKTIGEIINSVLTLIGTIIERFNPQDWEQALSTLVQNIVATIDWDYTKEKVSELAQKLAEFWNEVFKDDALWESIQKVAYELCDDILIFFRDFAWKFDFSNFGTRFTEELRKFLENFPYETLRQAVHNWVKGFVDFFNAVAKNLPFWKTLGKSIAQFISDTIVQALEDLANLDIVGMANAIATAIKEALERIPWDRINSSIQTIAKKIGDALVKWLTDEKLLTDIAVAIGKISSTIITALNNILTKVKEKAREIGQKIARALKEGFKEIPWDTVFTFPANLLNTISEFFAGILDEIPSGYELADWITSKLIMGLDAVNWDLLYDNLMRLAEKVRDFINGVLQNSEFWQKAGEVTGKVITITLDFLFELVNINGEDLGEAIVNYIDGLIDNIDIGKYLSKTVEIGIKLITALDVVLTGVDWGKLGDQIAQGIVDAIDTIWKNGGLIQKTIEDAFSVVNNLIKQTLTKMLENDSFRKIGETIGKVLMGIINGLYEFFMLNGDLIIEGIGDLGKSLADFLRSHKAEIIAKLNGIIDSLVGIINAIFDEKGALWAEIYDIISHLHLDQLITTIVREALIKLKRAIKIREAVWKGVIESGILDDIWNDILPLLKDIGLWFLKKIITLPITLATLPFKLLFKAIKKLFGFDDNGKADISGVFDNTEFTGKETAWTRFLGKLKEIKDWFAERFKGLKGWWDDINPFNKKKKAEIPVEIVTDEVDGKKKDVRDLVDTSSPVQLEFEDASLGKITTKLIEVDKFKGLKLEVDDILAKTLTLTDIFADTLHVTDIDSSGTKSGKYENPWAGAGNNAGVQTGTIYNDPEINASKITTPLLEAELIKAITMQVNEIVAQLLTVSQIVSELLEVTQIRSELLQVTTIESQLLNVSRIVADSLNLDDINADDLYLDDIYASRLHIEDVIGNFPSGGGSHTNPISNVDDTYYPVTDTVTNPSVGGGSSFRFGYDDNNNPVYPPSYTSHSTTRYGYDDYDYVPRDYNGNVLGDGYVPLGHETWRISGTTGTTNLTGDTGGWSQIIGLPSSDEILRQMGISGSVGDRIVGTPSAPTGTTGKSSIPYDGGDELEYLKQRLHELINNPIGEAAVLGNFVKESRLRPNNLQDSYEDSRFDDDSYTQWANNNRDAFIKDGKGYGYAQWTNEERKRDFVRIADGRDLSDPTVQADLIEYELTEKYKNLLERLRNATDLEQASNDVLHNYERPQKQDREEELERAGYSREMLDQINNGSYSSPWLGANNPLGAMSKTLDDIKNAVDMSIVSRDPNTGNTIYGYDPSKLKEGETAWAMAEMPRLGEGMSPEEAQKFIEKCGLRLPNSGAMDTGRIAGLSPEEVKRLLNGSDDLVNGLKNVDWNKLLRKIDWNKLLKNIDWNKLLDKVDLNRLLDKIDWDKLGEILGKILNDALADAIEKGTYEDPKRFGANDGLVKTGTVTNDGGFNFPDDYLSGEDVADIHYRLEKIQIDTEQMLKNVKKMLEDFDFAKLFLSDEAIGEIEKQLDNVEKLIDDFLGRTLKAFENFKKRVEDLFKDFNLAENILDTEKLYDKLREAEHLIEDFLIRTQKAVAKWKDDIKKLLDEIKEAAKDIFKNLSKDIEKELEKVLKAVQKYVKKIKDELQKLKDALDGVFDDLAKEAQEAFKTTYYIIKEWIDEIIKLIDKLKDAAKNMFKDLAKDTDNVWRDTYNAIKKWVDQIIALIKQINDATKHMWDGMVDEANATWEALYYLIKSWVKQILDEIQKVKDFALNLFKGMPENAEQEWIKLLDVVKKYVALILAEMKKITDKALSLFKGMADAANAEFQKLYNLISEWVKKINALFASITTAFRAAIQGLSDAMNLEMAEVYKAVDNWLLKIAQLLASFKPSMNLGLADAIKAELDRALQVVRDWVAQVIQIIKDAFGGLKALTSGKLEVFGTVNCNCDCGKDNKHLDNNTTAKSKNTQAVESLTTAIKNLQTSLGKVKCECDCCGNCNGCDGGSSGGSVSNSVGRSGNTQTGSTGTVDNGGGDIVINQGNGNVPLYADVNGKLVKLNDNTTSDAIKEGVANGIYSITDSKGNRLSATDAKKVRDYVKSKGWDDKEAIDSAKSSAQTIAKGISGTSSATADQKKQATALKNNINNAKDAKTAEDNLKALQKLQGDVAKAESNAIKSAKDSATKAANAVSGNDYATQSQKDKAAKLKAEADSATDSKTAQAKAKELENLQKTVQDKQDKAEKQAKDKAEKEKSKDLAVRVPDQDLAVYKDGVLMKNEEQAEKNGLLSKFLANRDKANARVDQYRKDAKTAYNAIKNSKYYDRVKTEADNAFDWINKNHNLTTGDSQYKNKLTQLQNLSAQAKEFNDAIKNGQAFKADDWKGKAFKPPQIQYKGKDTGYATKADIDAAKKANKQVEAWTKEIKDKIKPVIDKYGTSADKANVNSILKQFENPTTTTFASTQQIDGTWFDSNYQKLKNKADELNKKNGQKTSDQTSTKESNSAASQLGKTASSVNDLRTYLYTKEDKSDYVMSYSGNAGNSSVKKAVEDIKKNNKLLKAIEFKQLVNGNKLQLVGSANNATDAIAAFNTWYNNSFKVRGYQMGGVPNTGEIFVARENGTPEFVGSFGSKTAIANNDQIVTAVANGVSMANDRLVNAIENQTNSIETAIDRKDLDVQIGDRQIAEANRRGEKGLGQNFVN